MLLSKRVESDGDVEVLRNLRNEVREFMTGSQDYIEPEQQRQWFATLDHDNVAVFIYSVDSNWVGYGQLKREYSGPDVYGVTSHALTESARGLGLGRAILLDLIKYAESIGCHAMRAEIFKSNAASLGLVLKMGYAITRDMGDVVEVRMPL